MNRSLSLAAAGALAVVAAFGARRVVTPVGSGPVAERPIAIIGATVIPMTDAAATAPPAPVRLANHTVVIRSGRIAAVGPSASVAIPADAIRIDARGQFVIPGLVDAHVHLLGRSAASDLALYLANGVTTVRNMLGEPYHLTWRAEIERNARTGPTFITTGPFTDGLRSAAAARAFVRATRRAGYDAVKVHLPLDSAVYEGVVAAARAARIPVVGHAPGRPLGVAAAVRARQRTIEHAESIMQAETDEKDPEAANIPRIVALLRGSEVCVTPTLVTFEHIIRMTEQYPTEREMLARPEMRFVRADLRESWAPSQNEYVTRWRGHEAELPGALAKFRRQYAWMRHLVAALADARVPIVSGTDASIAMVVPGFSLHEELRLLVDAGLTPYAALRAATVDAARCLDHRGEFGIVRPGARADLVILASDPLLDVSAAGHPIGIVVRGRWLPADSLKAMLHR